jgi:hypothetical protein
MACRLARGSGHIRPQHYGSAGGAGDAVGHFRWHGVRCHTGCLPLCSVFDSPCSLVPSLHPGCTQAVDVMPVNNVPAARSATVEPANVDDWEVVEANAEYLTDNMLNQVDVHAEHDAIQLRLCVQQPSVHCLILCSTAHIWP